MTDADSKKLEEIEGYRQAVGYTTDDEFDWLISKLTGQGREIERASREIKERREQIKRAMSRMVDVRVEQQLAEAERDKLIGVLEGMVEHPYHVPEWDYGKTCSCSKCEQARTVLAEVKEKV